MEGSTYDLLVLHNRPEKAFAEPMSQHSSRRPIVIVTGANGGLGFGICHRLLFQLSRAPASNEPNYDGLTLILACRSKQRAEAARAKIYDIADEQACRAKRLPDYNGHADIFRRNLHIAIHIVDLADIQSVLHFADEIGQNYTYVSHLICNAGVASFSKIVWSSALKQLLTDFLGALTTPRYFLQSIGDLSQDGLGWVWQCNLFGHYVLFRALEPMMAKHTDARVIWISSHEASSKFYEPKDWQLVKAEHSYQCSKYQMNMISVYLDREALRSQLDGTPTVRHFIACPGVVGTSIANALLGTFTWLCMCTSFYLARFFGSPNHPIDIFKAAISAVHVSLTPLACLSSVGEAETSTNAQEPIGVGTAYLSKTDWWGREFVGTTELVQAQEEEAQTKELLENCDRLLKTFMTFKEESSIKLDKKN